MANVNDIILNEDYTPCIKSGDFLVGESTLQHQNHLMISEKGQYKHAVYAGVGIINYLNDEIIDNNELKQEITKQFTLDGMRVNKIVLKEVQKLIDAEYK